MKIVVVLIAAALGMAGSLDRVTSVYDGDTITTSSLGKVRLVQIDTPELASNECYGREAAMILKAWLPKYTTVKLVRDPRTDDHDRYGRHLRYVIRDRRNLNIQLVSVGAATPYFYGGVRGIHASALLRARNAAARHKRGMWGSCKVTWSPTRAVTTNYG